MLPLLPPRDPIDPSSHPAALLLNEKKKILYIALANRDSVAAVAIGRHAGKHGSMHTLGFFDTRLPGQTYFGAFPDALALSPDGNRLYAADASLDAVAVFNPHALKTEFEATPSTRTDLFPRNGIPQPWQRRRMNCMWLPEKAREQAQTISRQNMCLRTSHTRSCLRLHKPTLRPFSMVRWRRWIVPALIGNWTNSAAR